MDNKSTRSTTDFSNIKIDSLQYNNPARSQTSKNMLDLKSSTELSHNEIQFGEQKLDEDVKEMGGHGLNDQLISSQCTHRDVIKEALQTFEKFTGLGDAEQWLTSLLRKFDLLQVDMDDRITFVPAVLTAEAFIWYIQNENHMLTFSSFAKLFLQQFTTTKIEGEKATSIDHILNQQQLITTNGNQGDVFSSLRNQLLLSYIEKLPKFSGKSKQNVSKWLREIQQAMHVLKLKDAEKLFFISTCLEADARDWFFDNSHLFTTWISFTQKLIHTFESAGKADISFNKLRHYQQGFTQDVRHYYFEIMKLCKEANPLMDDATKLQYLKDGLKPSLRFDIFLKNPQSTDDFLEYAQKVEELKSLDERDNIIDRTTNNKSPDSMKLMSKSKNDKSPQKNQQSLSQELGFHKAYKGNQVNNNTDYSSKINQQHTTITATNGYIKMAPKPPYQCYNCGATDHFFRNCPHFQ